MRYLIAMLIAIPAALGATIYVSGHIADWYTNLYTYDDPDAVAAVHATVFMISNVTALAIGWAVGWWLGGALIPKARDG
jgi:hypothetical protein